MTPPRVTLFCLLLAAVFSQVTASCLLIGLQTCDGEGPVTLGPMNPRIYQGENLTMTCEGRGDPEELEFYVNDASVPADLVRILDNQTASMTIADAGMALNHALLRCSYRRNANPACDDCQLLNIFDPPEPVVGVTCVAHGWTSNLNCSWSLGKHYERRPTVELKWRIPVVSCTWSPCPKQNINYCLWSSTAGGGDFSMKTIDVAISVRSGTRQVSSYYKINTRTTVQPGPVQDLQSRPVNSSCIDVTWRPFSRQYKRLYKVVYSSRWNTSQGRINVDENFKNGDGQSVTLCDLIPYTKYHISVRAQPAEDVMDINGSDRYHGNCSSPAEEDVFTHITGTGYESEERTTETATYGDVPNMAPAMAEGGYMWKLLEGGKYRSVFVYWQPLDELHTNGPLKGYDVTTTDSSKKSEEHSTTSYAIFHESVLRSDEAYSVTVQARNVNGTSPRSTVHIPPLKQALSPPEFTVTMSSEALSGEPREVEVEWPGFRRTSEATGFTLYTCRKEEANCARPIDWRYIPKGNKSIVFKMASPEQYLYGLSVETKRGSSGFHWQSCVYTKGANLTEAPGNLQVHAGTGDSSLLVSWDGLPCDSGKPQVGVYRLEYCEGRSPGPSCRYMNVSSNSVVLHDLKEDEVYRVRVQGITTAGSPGRWSAASNTTTNAVSDVRKTIGLVVGTMAGVALVVLIVLCYRKMKKRCRIPAIEDILPDKQATENQQVIANSRTAIRDGIYQNGTGSQESFSGETRSDQSNFPGAGQRHNPPGLATKDIHLQTLSLDIPRGQSQPEKVSVDSIQALSLETHFVNNGFSDTDEGQNQTVKVSTDNVAKQTLLGASNVRNIFSSIDQMQDQPYKEGVAYSRVANGSETGIAMEEYHTLSMATPTDQDRFSGTEQTKNQRNMLSDGYVHVTNDGEIEYVLNNGDQSKFPGTDQSQNSPTLPGATQTENRTNKLNVGYVQVTTDGEIRYVTNECNSVSVEALADQTCFPGIDHNQNKVFVDTISAETYVENQSHPNEPCGIERHNQAINVSTMFNTPLQTSVEISVDQNNVLCICPTLNQLDRMSTGYLKVTSHDETGYVRNKYHSFSVEAPTYQTGFSGTDQNLEGNVDYIRMTADGQTEYQIDEYQSLSAGTDQTKFMGKD